MEAQRGQRDKLDKYLDVQQEISVLMQVQGSAVYDFCCFGVDATNKLSDERYMVFYNQTRSPEGEISFQQHSAQPAEAEFRCQLSRLPQSINKLVFTVSIDGPGLMREIASHTLSIRQNNQNLVNLALRGTDFQQERAIITMEIYKKDGLWRFAALASGFNGGLGDLLRSYGGEEAVGPQAAKTQAAPLAPPVQPATPPPAAKAPVRLEKISLKKGEKLSLRKHSGAPIIVENGWTAAGKDYDLKALVRYRDGRLIYVGAANRDEVLSTPEGAVRHGGDIKRPGELEHITISWHPDIASIAVSSYSALENGMGSFNQYGVFVRIKNGPQTVEIPAANTSANSRSYTLCFGEILFGKEKDALEVSALELYSRPDSEYRVGYKGDQVVMDIGPVGQKK